jgi:uncharacterized membrane protein YczE
MTKKIIIITLGVFGIGLGVALCIVANFGIDPCSTFNSGLANIFIIPIGTMIIITNVVIFGFMLMFYREGIHLGTVIATFGVGISINICLPLLANLSPETMISRTIIALIGILTILVSVALYMSPNMGIAPWDSVGYMIQKVINVKYGTIRTVYELLAVAVGIYLGAQFGLVTIILAFFLGPAIDYLGNKFRTILKLN